MSGLTHFSMWLPYLGWSAAWVGVQPGLECSLGRSISCLFSPCPFHLRASLITPAEQAIEPAFAGELTGGPASWCVQRGDWPWIRCGRTPQVGDEIWFVKGCCAVKLPLDLGRAPLRYSWPSFPELAWKLSTRFSITYCMPVPVPDPAPPTLSPTLATILSMNRTLTLTPDLANMHFCPHP